MLATVEVPRANGTDQTFAARSLNLRNIGDSKVLDQLLRIDRVNGVKPWGWFESLGEIHFALMRAARIAGYTKIFPVELSPTGEIVEVIESGPEVDIVDGIYSRQGGLRYLIERFFLQQKVPGESHLCRWKEGGQYDGYIFASSRELSTPRTDGLGLVVEQSASRGGLKLTTLPQLANIDADFTKAIAAQDYLGRVWSPSPIYLDMPESPLNPMATQCELLHDMTLMMAATMKSRFVLGGLMYFPNTVQNVLDGARKIAGGTGKSMGVLDALYQIMKKNVEATDNSVAISPILLMGDPEAGDQIKQIIFDRQIIETDIKLRSELIDRILFGMDIIPQATTSGEDVNHFGAWQASADELRLAVIPDVEALCWALRRLILIPQARAENVGEDRLKHIGIGYDLSAASVRANRMGDAKTLVDLGILGPMAALKAGGWNANDILSGVDLIRWVGRLVKDPYLAFFGEPEADKIDWAKTSVKAAGRKPDGTPEMPVGPGVGDPGNPDDEDTDRPEADKPV